MDLANGYLLLTDFGACSLLQRVGQFPAEADALYRAAIDTLVDIQAASDRFGARFASYDAELLGRELDLFPEWYCERHCEKPWDDAAADGLGAGASLADRFGAVAASGDRFTATTIRAI